MVGTPAMGWSEAARLARVLETDTSSHLYAAEAGWHFPYSREAIAVHALANLVAGAVGMRESPIVWPSDMTPDEIAAHNADVLAILSAAESRAPEGVAMQITKTSIPD